MTVLKVITVGDPRLRQRSRDVQKATPELQTFIDNMIETMHVSDGIGLAAVQVAELLNLIVVEIPETEEIPGSGRCYVVLNPEIVKASHDTEIGIEGCLSIPGYVGEVERFTSVIVRGLDRRGKRWRIRATGLLARVFQHEIDHTKGILYIDRLVAPDRIWHVPEGDEERIEAEQKQANSLVVRHAA